MVALYVYVNLCVVILFCCIVTIVYKYVSNVVILNCCNLCCYSLNTSVCKIKILKSCECELEHCNLVTSKCVLFTCRIKYTTNTK